MEEVESISSILESPLDKGVTAAPPAAESKSEPAPEAKETKEPEAKAPTRDESGRFAKTEEPKVEEKPESKPETKPEDTVDGRTAALRAERQRRQQLEARLRELEGQRPTEKVSIFDDEEKGISQRFAEAARPLREANFNMSVKLARLSYKDDFEKAETAFFDSAESDPRLYDQLRASSDPGEFIMTVGTQIAELGAVGGNFVAYREKVTGEMKAEIAKRDDRIKALEAQIESLAKAQKELETIPRSLNKGSESAPRSVADADPQDINEIVRFNY